MNFFLNYRDLLEMGLAQCLCVSVWKCECVESVVTPNPHTVLLISSAVSHKEQES